MAITKFHRPANVRLWPYINDVTEVNLFVIKTAWNKEVILTELTDLIGDYPGAIR